MKRTLALLFAFMCCFTFEAHAAAPAYIYMQFHQAGSTGSSLRGINTSGQLVGNYSPHVSGSSGNGFLFSDNTLSDIKHPNGNSTKANDINDKGSLVGSYAEKNTYITKSYVYNNGVFKDIRVPGVSNTYAHGINNKGDVVGKQFHISGTTVGFKYSNNQYTEIKKQSAILTDLRDINDSGDIVGFYTSNYSSFNSFIYNGGNFTDINYPGASKTYAEGINNSGNIVGYYQEPVAYGYHGFIYDGVNYTTVDFPGALDTKVYSISNNGKLAGEFRDRGGKLHGFTATLNVIKGISVSLMPNRSEFKKNGKLLLETVVNNVLSSDVLTDVYLSIRLPDGSVTGLKSWKNYNILAGFSDEIIETYAYKFNKGEAIGLYKLMLRVEDSSSKKLLARDECYFSFCKPPLKKGF